MTILQQRPPSVKMVSVPNSSNPKDGWKKITYKQAAIAVNRVAHKLVKSTGLLAKGEFPTVAYIGPSDVRYLVFVLGAVKAGYLALLISPRNSQEGQLSLFEQTNCNVIWFEATYKNMAQSWLQERDMHAFMTFPVAAWFPKEHIEPYPYSKTFDTGLPKPIVCRQGMWAIGEKYHHIAEWKGRGIWVDEMARRSKRTLHPMPLFHAAALSLSLIMIHSWDHPSALGIGDRPVSADMVVECLKYADVESVILPPAILEEMSQSEEAIDGLKKLPYVGFGGGNLAGAAGDRLVKSGVTLLNLILATEFAPFPMYWQPNRELWRYFIFNSELFGCQWTESAEKNAYEQIIVRKSKDPGFQGFFYTYPEDKEYRIKDLYKPHPSLSDHWIYHGRADSIIVFSNGETLNPVSMEHILTGHPGVKGALVVGSNRFQPALIIEPVEYPKNEEEAKKFLDDVWPTVVEANKETRAGTIRMYKNEIYAIYERASEVVSSEAPKPHLGSKEALTESIGTMFEQWLRAPKLEPDTDFFTVGIDSMQVINASRLLRAGLEAAGITVDASALATRIICGHPTHSRLADYLFPVKYAGELPAARRDKPPSADEDQVIVITGTTGALGSYMLEVASRSPRRTNAADRGLDIDFSKAEFLHADMSRFDLGLGKETYHKLLGEVDRVIHNQWPINFNMPVESFEPHIRAVRNLADFTCRAAKQVPIVFISSIGTVDAWKKSEPVPEQSLHNLSLSAGGYDMSTLVSSLSLEKVSEVSGVPTEIIRVEWLPSIVASSLYLGMLPDSLGPMLTVDWTPIEGIAKIMLEDINGYFHGVNPSTTDWTTLAKAVREFYGDRIEKMVSFDEWPWARAAREGQRHVVMDLSRTSSRSKTMREVQAVTPNLMKNWCRQWGF
ncbi:acetyl-CoA synthetase-like protein [Parathielavia hyrcaniae]|uniref:Acetyl-CoA synthetase-like protein n=1 Tax=Parathielavia hyrcaniae TaxID=113614 RepID=A0AAN6SXF2_9PEZI|nr:acetyl-CoA synthetase-like protein [Parathielavia hyrcaniae]